MPAAGHVCRRPVRTGRRPSKRRGTEEWTMKAEVGDWLVVKGTTVEQPDQRGLITEVRSADGSPPYVVRWHATGHVATVIPGADAVVAKSYELEVADERNRLRAASVDT